MKTVVAVCVHDRFDNIKRWLECWEQCERTDAKLIIIHNGTESDRPKWGRYCRERGIEYILRRSGGMDIGALQDIARNRLQGFSESEYLIWCTDDCLPMSKTFVSEYVSQMRSDVGIVAMHVSAEIKPHVRTTGFCIRRETLSKIVFPIDPISTKQECYLFEWLHDTNYFMAQIEKMGLSVVQINTWQTAPLWDSGRPDQAYGYVDRVAEHEAVFPRIKKPKVLIIATAYNRFPQLISSLICQTYTQWELNITHDGPNNTGLAGQIAAYDDSRITYSETPERENHYGNGTRRQRLVEVKNSVLGADCEYVLLSNEDNYHMPTYLEKLVGALEADKHKVAAYCSSMIHNYTGYEQIQSYLTRGKVDMASAVFRKNIPAAIGWPEDVAESYKNHSADWFFFEKIIQKYGFENWVKVPGCLLVHN